MWLGLYHLKELSVEERVSGNEWHGAAGGPLKMEVVEERWQK